MRLVKLYAILKKSLFSTSTELPQLLGTWKTLLKSSLKTLLVFSSYAVTILLGATADLSPHVSHNTTHQLQDNDHLQEGRQGGPRKNMERECQLYLVFYFLKKIYQIWQISITKYSCWPQVTPFSTFLRPTVFHHEKVKSISLKKCNLLFQTLISSWHSSCRFSSASPPTDESHCAPQPRTGTRRPGPGRV